MTAKDTVDARIAAARRWHRGVTGADAPEWDDVELVVRLRLTDETTAQQILFGNVTALLRNWRSLQTAISGDSDSVTERHRRESTPRAGGGDGDGQPSQGPTGREASTSLEGGIVGERLRALTVWYASAREAGRDLEGLSESTLRKIATAGPTQARAFKRFGSGAYRNAAELLRVLGEVSSRTEELNASAPTPGERPDTGKASLGEPSHQPDPENAADDVRPMGLTSTADFAEFDYTAQPSREKPMPARVSFAALGDDSLQVTWPSPPDDGRVRIFRVVTNDTYAPVHSPQLGEVIAATFDTQVVDNREFSSPVRHVAIWVNEGWSEEQARMAQPSLYAAGGCVLPVRRCEVREDEGTVIGQWEAAEGVLRVDVLRVPVIQAAQQQHYNHQYRLRSEVVGRGGFTDDEATPGEEYEYRVYAVASVSGEDEELSPYVARRVKLQALVEPVTDLCVTQGEGAANTYELRWTMPSLGNVEIYRTESPPAPGIDQVVLDRATLERQGLTPELRLARALDRVDDKGGMKDVPWPKGWSRAYFTPVTVVDEEQIRVGRHQILTRASPVSHVRLVERVDEQYLTFAWPEGVSIVNIYQGAKGGELLNPEDQSPIAELSEDEYAKYGGAHLPNPLPSEGCAVHVVGTSYSRGRAVLSEPVTVQYDGLVRLSYDVLELSAGGRFSRRPNTLRRIVVRCDSNADNVPLVLVHNARRMPLYDRDGEELQRRILSFVAGTSQVFAEDVDLRGLTGFVRLFVDVPETMEHLLAVLDPAVGQLRCG